MHALQPHDEVYAPSAIRGTSRLVTNGFEVDVPGEVEAIVRDLPDPSEVKLERERLASFWFVHWIDGKLFHLRLKAGGPNVEGKPVALPTAMHPWLLRARLDDAIEFAMPKYAALKKRPFTFLAQKSELIEKASEATGISHELLSGFRVTPKFALSPKVYEPTDGATRIGIFVTIGMRHDIDAELPALIEAGVDVNGMYAVRRNPAVGERRLLGRIQSVEAGRVTLFEATGETDHPASEVKLEGSKENFSRCLGILLGRGYKRLLIALDDQEAAYRTGPTFDQAVSKMGEFLARKPIALGLGVNAVVGKRITLNNDGQTRSVHLAPAVEYVFDRTGAKSADLAWPGLSQYGPFDRSSFANRSPRILVVYPISTQGKVEVFLRAFRDGMGSNFPGFSKGFIDLFGLVKIDFVMCPVSVDSGDRNGPHTAYTAAIEDKLANAGEVHAGIVVLFEEQARLCGLQKSLHTYKIAFAHARHSNTRSTNANDYT